MHIFEALELGKECGLTRVREAIENVILHSPSLFTYEKVKPEVEQMLHEWETVKRNSDFTQKAYITKVMNWMNRDNMCYCDELGGLHMNGEGTNPRGVHCGECSNLSCVGCSSACKAKEEE